MSWDDAPVRRLPLSVAPAPGESLAGFLLALSDRLMLPPTYVAERVGLTSDNAASVPPAWALNLPLAPAKRLRQATGLTVQESERLTLSHYDGRLFRLQTSEDVPALPGTTPLTRSWCTLTRRRACPDCLTEAVRDQTAPWRLAWQTPWTFACVRHDRLLSDRCPACDTPIGGGSRYGLIPDSHSRVPATSCRARVDGSPCAQPLAAGPDDVRPASPGPRVLAAQTSLDALLHAADHAEPMPPTSSLGAPVTADEYLRDARLLSLLADAARGWDDTDGLPDPVRAALGRQQERRATETRGQDTRRDWYAPPETAPLTAGLLVPALELLALPVQDAAPEIDRLARQAREHESLLANRMRWTSGASPRLLALLTPATQRRFTAKALRRSAGRSDALPDLHPDRVPAFLPEPDHDRLFGWVDGSAKTLRRAVPLMAVRLLTGWTLAKAAEHLGVPETAAVMAVARAGRMVKDPGQDHCLRESVIRLATEWADLGTLPDHARRRREMSAFYFSADEWNVIVEPHRRAEMSRGGKRVPWDERRDAATVFVWLGVTGGEAAYSPVAQQRESRAGLSKEMDALTRAQSQLKRDLEALAGELAAVLDSGAGLPELSGRGHRAARAN